MFFYSKNTINILKFILTYIGIYFDVYQDVLSNNFYRTDSRIEKNWVNDELDFMKRKNKQISRFICFNMHWKCLLDVRMNFVKNKTKKGWFKRKVDKREKKIWWYLEVDMTMGPFGLEYKINIYIHIIFLWKSIVRKT